MSELAHRFSSRLFRKHHHLALILVFATSHTSNLRLRRLLPAIMARAVPRGWLSLTADNLQQLAGDEGRDSPSDDDFITACEHVSVTSLESTVPETVSVTSLETIVLETVNVTPPEGTVPETVSVTMYESGSATMRESTSADTLMLDDDDDDDKLRQHTTSGEELLSGNEPFTRYSLERVGEAPAKKTRSGRQASKVTGKDASNMTGKHESKVTG